MTRHVLVGYGLTEQTGSHSLVDGLPGGGEMLVLEGTSPSLLTKEKNKMIFRHLIRLRV